MKKVLAVMATCVIVLAAGFAAQRSRWHRPEPTRKQLERVHRDAAPWVPSDAELSNQDRGVGWVFGRMIGVADAPGSPSHMPFGSGSHRPTMLRTKNAR